MHTTVHARNVINPVVWFADAAALHNTCFYVYVLASFLNSFWPRKPASHDTRNHVCDEFTTAFPVTKRAGGTAHMGSHSSSSRWLQKLLCSAAAAGALRALSARNAAGTGTPGATPQAPLPAGELPLQGLPAGILIFVSLALWGVSYEDTQE